MKRNSAIGIYIFGLLFVIIFSTNVQAQQFSINHVPLTWIDFRQVERKMGDYTASVNTAYRYSIDDTNDSLIVNMECYINKMKSVVDRSFLKKASAYDKELLLKHEKGHVAIALIYHKIMQNILTSSSFTKPVKQEVVDSVCRLVSRMVAGVNNNYDNETNHGINIGIQNTWEQRLMEQLNNAYPDQKAIPMKLSIKVRKGISY